MRTSDPTVDGRQQQGNEDKHADERQDAAHLADRHAMLRRHHRQDRPPCAAMIGYRARTVA